jgi:hypothetical protein
MKKAAMVLMAGCLLGGLVSCAASHFSAKMNYYHEKIIPAEYFRVVRYTASEIEFEVRVRFQQSYLYHLVLEGNTPLAEGWFPAIKGQEQSYNVILKAKPGVEFAVGKTYRLCIGEESPELVGVHSSNYRCTADYEFKLD